jgi:hypothetical protein
MSGRAETPLPCDGTIQARAIAQQRDPGARHQLLWGVTVVNKALQPTLIGRMELQVNGPLRDIHAPQRAGIPCRT